MEQRQVFGTPEDLEAVLAESKASQGGEHLIHRSAERDRPGPQRAEERKTYRFSKDWQVHEAMTYLTMYSYNCCGCVRTLRVKNEQDRWQERTPAIAAGMTDHVWTWKEWFGRTIVQLA